jgi:hypothetical protein
MRFRYRIIINGNRSDVNKKIHKFSLFFVKFYEFSGIMVMEGRLLVCRI